MIFGYGNEESAQVIIFPVFIEDLEEKAHPSLPQSLKHFKLRSYMGESGAVTWFFGRRDEPDLLLVGIGKKAKFHSKQIRDAAGCAGRAVEKEMRQNALVSFTILDSNVRNGFCESEAITAWVEGWLLGTYTFDQYKNKKSKRCVQQLDFALEENEESSKAIRKGEIIAEGCKLTRDLTNEPPNILRPKTLVERAIENFSGTDVKVKVYEGESLEQHQMVGLIAVGKGSKHLPALLELRYCTDEALPLIALIGKGITFDTGGISLKRDHDISDMRMDMAGAGAVIGALDIIVKSKMQANVVILVAAAENMPDGGALLPGEVLQYPNGVSVQVGNTDSEGRLVLADALIHAHTLGAQEAIDIATLTYSVVGALGSQYAGIWGNDVMVQTMQSAGEKTGEKVWQLPLVDEYETYLDSDYADISNISHVAEAGATTAALFIRKFVDPALSWVHIDMAGQKDVSSTKGCLVSGATGYGARLLAEYIAQRSTLP